VIILDKPYVSDFLKDSVCGNRTPVLDTAFARQALQGRDARLVDEAAFVRLVREQGAHPRIYANSENAIEWIDEHLGFCDLAQKIALFKDKIRFRELLRELYPDYFFTGGTLDELAALDPAGLPFPLVLKPAVGFFSLGVRVVPDRDHWAGALEAVRAEAACAGCQYPGQVLDMGRFVLEQAIEGEEFAVDAYYDEQGRVVILNVLAHLFASAEDVSDRVYITSTSIVDAWRPRFTELLQAIGDAAGLRNFPVHAELRADPKRGLAPIEINPMRFAGWCCTDIAAHAYGFDPVQLYLSGGAPEWQTLRERRKGSVWAIVVADLPADLDRGTVASVDYQAFLAQFSEPLELRKVDWRAYSVFAFLFARAPENDLDELRAMLGQDLRRYLRFAPAAA